MAVERTMEPITPGLRREAASVLARAFRQDPGMRTYFRDMPPEEQVKRLCRAYQAELGACMRRGIPVCLRETGVLTAVAVIWPPTTYPVSALEQIEILVRALAGQRPYRLGTLLQWLHGIQKLAPKEPHFYLGWLGVEPSCQGQGMGSTLLQFLIEQADEAQVGCYLETDNPRNLPLYERFGFRVVGEEEIVIAHHWLMWREPMAGVAA